MAIASTTNWEFRSLATANMLNGGGFNTANANFIADFTTDSNTANTNSPVLSSATYNFVAGDVGAWIYVKSGTNWTPGWYQIASVASNKATLSAAIGQAIQVSSQGIYGLNTVAGCATVGTPTSGNCGVDYSQQTTAITTKTDLACTTPSTTITSATGAFTPVMVGNIMHITAITGVGTLVGWYEIVSYVSATSVVLDSTPAPSNNGSSGTYYVGGALDLAGSLQDSFFEMIMGGNKVWVKNDAAYTLGAAISVVSTNSTAANSSFIIGYNSYRGDEPTGSSRPSIDLGALANTFGPYQFGRNFIFTGTNALPLVIGTGSRWRNIKSTNTSTTAGRRALSTSASDASFFMCETISQNGIGIELAGSNARAYGCYNHDSDIGISAASSRMGITLCLVESCKTASINCTATTVTGQFANNTLYGSEAKIGTGVNFAGTGNNSISLYNNIIYGFATGVNQATTQQFSNVGAYNDFFNNTTDVSLYSKDVTDLALDPGFVNASQLTGSTATIVGTVLTQSGGDFSTVTDNVDYIRVVSGTGATAGIYLITSHTSTTVTVNNTIGTNATADKVWVIPVGHNFQIGTNLKAVAFPGLFQGSETTSYLDTGAVQRQETTSSGGGGSYTFC